MTNNEALDELERITREKNRIDEQIRWLETVVPGQLFWNVMKTGRPTIMTDYTHSKTIMIVSLERVKNELSTYARNLVHAPYPFYWIVTFMAGEKMYTEEFYTFTEWNKRFHKVRKLEK